MSTANSLQRTLNRYCDGIHCKSNRSEVRAIPIDSSSTVHLCESCYLHEVAYNDMLEQEQGYRILPQKDYASYRRVK